MGSPRSCDPIGKATKGMTKLEPATTVASSSFMRKSQTVDPMANAPTDAYRMTHRYSTSLGKTKLLVIILNMERGIMPKDIWKKFAINESTWLRYFLQYTIVIAQRKAPSIMTIAKLSVGELNLP